MPHRPENPGPRPEDPAGPSPVAPGGGRASEDAPRLLRVDRSRRPARGVPPERTDATAETVLVPSADLARDSAPGGTGAADATVLVPQEEILAAGADSADDPHGTERKDDVERAEMAYPGGYGPPAGRSPSGRSASSGRYGPGGGTRDRPSGTPPWYRGPQGSGGARPRVPRKWIVIGVVVLLILYPLGLFWTAWSHLDEVDAMPDGERPADTPGTTYLVVGSDSREDLDADARRKLGTGKVAGQRTDTIMILHVSDGGGPNVLISVPRDSYVPVPGHDRNKINSAYAFGGPQLLINTVEQVSGLRIDGYVETGLMGYADLVDAVGGIEVCSKRAMKDEKAHLDIPAGCQEFDGATALGYSRARYSDPRGDLGRVERQRQVLASIAARTFSPSVLLVPWRSFPAAAAGGDALRVNEGTSPWGLLKFINAMRGVAGGKGLSLTVPIGNPALSTPAGSAVQWDREKALALFENLKKDDTQAVRPLAEEQKKQSG
jgi:LCP family protein required for cell wall assembly